MNKDPNAYLETREAFEEAFPNLFGPEDVDQVITIMDDKAKLYVSRYRVISVWQEENIDPFELDRTIANILEMYGLKIWLQACIPVVV